MKLVLVDGCNIIHQYFSEKLIIGKDKACSLRIEGPEIENFHCEFFKNHQGLFIKSLSAGQVFVNEVETEQSQLFLGDRIRISNWAIYIDNLGLSQDECTLLDKSMPKVKKLFKDNSDAKQSTTSSFKPFDLNKEAAKRVHQGIGPELEKVLEKIIKLKLEDVENISKELKQNEEFNKVWSLLKLKLKTEIHAEIWGEVQAKLSAWEKEILAKNQQKSGSEKSNNTIYDLTDRSIHLELDKNDAGFKIKIKKKK